MNLNVYKPSSYYGRRVVMLPYTAKGKPRCQQTISTGWSHYNQCDRPASFFEPHHERLYKHSPARKTTRRMRAVGGYEERQIYADDVLFGYCRMHSMTLHEERRKAQEEADAQAHAARKTVVERKNYRETLFENMMLAIENDDFETAKNIFTRMREEGFTIRVNREYL